MRVLDCNGDRLQIASGGCDFIEAIVTLQYRLFLDMNYCTFERTGLETLKSR